MLQASITRKVTILEREGKTNLCALGEVCSSKNQNKVQLCLPLKLKGKRQSKPD
jgi:hypothetical protein